MNWLFDDNINTDLITPGRYNITTDPEELSKILFIEHSPEFCKNAKRGDFVIAGNNFGCGSSRETAATALKARGIKAVIAKSFARIFYRNCLNKGLLAIIADTSTIEPNDILELQIDKSIIYNKTKKQKIPATIPEVMIKLHKSEGIIPYLQKNGVDAIEALFNK